MAVRSANGKSNGMGTPIRGGNRGSPRGMTSTRASRFSVRFLARASREVRQKMQAALVDLNNHQYQKPSKMTVGEWLETWEQEYLVGIKPLTKLSYTQHIRNHILPALGNRKLQDLSGPEIQKFYNQLLREGGKIRCHDKDGQSYEKRRAAGLRIGPLVSQDGQEHPWRTA